ncbi:MAG TPA: type IV pilus assembly protein PilM [Candidatus Paceibacterota bacterium]
MPPLEKLKNFFSGFQKENRFLGVDIGTSSIKVAQLRKEKERAILETYGEISLASYGTGDVGRSVAVSAEKLKEAISDLVKEAKITAKSAVLSIPLRHSFLTLMRMPRLPDAELKEAIPYEARKYIPVPLTDVIVDWWVLPPSGRERAETSIGSGTRSFAEIFLAAVPKDIIENYKNIFLEVGLEIASFEIEPFSFARASLRRDLGTVLLMDFGARSVKFAIADAGAIRASYNIEKGSQDISLTLSQSLGVDFERAEILKREVGLTHSPETEGISQVIEPIVDIINSAGESFLLDWKRRGGETIDKVIVGGGGAMLKNINDSIIKKYGVEVETTNPFSKVVYPAFLEPSLKEIGATFTNAIGLALKNF